MECPVCHNRRLELLLLGVPDYEYGLPAKADFYRCQDCRAIPQIPPPRDLKALYPDSYEPYAVTGLSSRLKNLQARLRLRQLRAELPGLNAEILELGCAGGHFLHALKSLGYAKLTGVDFNPEMGSTVKGLGARFLTGDIETLDFNGRYGWIVMNNVIEHLLDPGALLKRLQSHLLPGGKIVIQTPNAEALSRSLFGRYWSGWHAPRHIHVFSEESIARLGSEAGWPRVKFLSFPDPAAWAMSFQNLTGAKALGLLSLPFWLPAASLEFAMGRNSTFVAVLSR